MCIVNIVHLKNDADACMLNFDCCHISTVNMLISTLISILISTPE